jgi:hypothetical protein
MSTPLEAIAACMTALQPSRVLISKSDRKAAATLSKDCGTIYRGTQGVEA